MNKYFLPIILCAISSTSRADCVYGVKDKSKFLILDNHAVLFQGGYGSDVIVKTFCTILKSSELTVLKDDFCSHDSSVLYVDGEVCDAREVTKVQ